MMLNQAFHPDSVACSADGYTQALGALLSPPSLSSPADPRLESSSASAVPRGNRPEALREEGGGGGGSGSITYRMFLECLMRSENKGFVRAIRLFLFSILGNGGDVSPLSARPRAPASRTTRSETEDVEVYGSSFLVQRFEIDTPELIIHRSNTVTTAMQPSWCFARCFT